MRKLIWRIKYTRQMAKRLGADFWAYKMGWYCSWNHIYEHGEDWMEDDPAWCADEELTYWTE